MAIVNVTRLTDGRPPSTGPPRDNRPLVLVVDDEESYRQALASGWPARASPSRSPGDGHEALRLFHRVHPDLVLLDVMLPDQSGIEICQQMRGLKPVPIIMVTARDSEVDVVLGLELGASDYVAKPFRLRELVARMRAVLRRGVAVAEHHEEVLAVGPVRLDAGRREVTVARGAGRPLPQGVRPARPPDVAQRPGGHPGLVHRPAVVGPGADRHPDARHPHQAPAPQGRARPGQPPPPGHRAGRRVPLRGRSRGAPGTPGAFALHWADAQRRRRPRLRTARPDGHAPQAERLPRQRARWCCSSTRRP